MAVINGVDWTVKVKRFTPGVTTDIETADFLLDDQYGFPSGSYPSNHTGAQPYEIWKKALTLESAGSLSPLTGNHEYVAGTNSIIIIRVACDGDPFTAVNTPPDEPAFNFDITYGGVTPSFLGHQSDVWNTGLGTAHAYLYYIPESSLNGPGTYYCSVAPDSDCTSLVGYGVAITQVVNVEQNTPSGYNDATTLNEFAWSTEFNTGDGNGGERKLQFDLNTTTLEANSIIIGNGAQATQGAIGWACTSAEATEGSSPATREVDSADGIWQESTTLSGGATRTYFGNAGSTGFPRGKAASFHVDNDLASWNKRVYFDQSINAGAAAVAARWNREAVIDGAFVQPAGSLVTASASSSELTTSHTLATGSNRMVVAFITAENASGNGIPDLSALQYGGVPMTQVVSLSAEGSRGDYYHKCYVILEEDFPIGTTHTVSTVHLAGSAAGIRIQIQQYNDVVQSVPTGADVTATLFTSTNEETITVDRHLPGDAVLFAGAANHHDTGGIGQVTSVDHDGPSRKLSTQFNDGGYAGLGLHTHYFTALHGGPADFNMQIHNQQHIALIGVRLIAAGKATTTEIDVTPYTQGVQVDQDAPMGKPSQSRATIRLDNSGGDFTPLLGNTFSTVDWFSYGLFIEATVPGQPTSVVFHGIIRDFKISDDSTNSYVDVLALDALSLAARGPVADFPTGFVGSAEAVIEGLLSTTFTPVDDGIALPDLGMTTAEYRLTETPIYPHTVKAEGTDLALRGSARTILDNHVLPAGPMMLFSTRIIPSGSAARYEGQLVGPILVKTQGSRIIYELTDDTGDATRLKFTKLTFDFLTSDIINRCKANRISPLAVEKGAQTRTSIAKYGVRSKDFPQLAANTNSDVFSVAALWASRFSDPKFSILEVDLGYANEGVALQGTIQQQTALAGLLDIRSSLWAQCDIITSNLTGTPELTTTPTSPLTTIDALQQGTARLAALAVRLDPVSSDRSVTGHGVSATQFTDDAGASPPDYSFNHTLIWGYNRIVLIAIMGDTTGTPDDVVTYGGVTATLITTQLDPGSNQFVRWHYIPESSLPSVSDTEPKTYTVVVSRTNDGPQRAWVSAFQQASQSTPPSAGGGSLTSPATTASIATVPAASLTLTAGSSKIPAGTILSADYPHSTYQTDAHTAVAVVIEAATSSVAESLGTDATQVMTTSTSFSFSHTLDAGSSRIAILAIVGRAPSSPHPNETVTYGGVSMTAFHDYEIVRSGSDITIIRFFYLLESSLPADGANTLSVTGASTSGKAAWFGVFSGANQAAPTNITDVGTFGTGNNTITSDAIEPSVGDNLIFASTLTTSQTVNTMYHYSGTLAESLIKRLDSLGSSCHSHVSTLNAPVSGKVGQSALIEHDWGGQNVDREVVAGIGIDPNSNGETVSIIGTLDNADASTGSISHTLPAGSNRMVLMALLGRDGSNYPTVSSITYGGVSATEIGRHRVHQLDTAFVILWYVPESSLTTGANTASITRSGSGTRDTFYVWAVEDARQPTSIDDFKFVFGGKADAVYGTNGPDVTRDTTGAADGGLIMSFGFVQASTSTSITFTYETPTVVQTIPTLVNVEHSVGPSATSAIGARTANSADLRYVTFDDAVGSEVILDTNQQVDTLSAGGFLSTGIGNYSVAPSYDTPVAYEPNGIGQPNRLLITGRQVRVNHKWFGIKLKTRPEYYAGFILDEDRLNSSDTI